MNLSDLREKRTKLYSDLSEMGKIDAPTSETRAKFDAVAADLDILDEDIKRAERLESMEAEQRSRQANRPNPAATDNRDAEIRSSLRDYLLTGKVESRDLTSANTGVIIPQLFDATVNEAQKSYGEIYNLVDVIETENGNPIKIIFDDDTANGLSAVTVGTAASSVQPTLTGGTLQVDNFTTGVVRVGYDLLADAGFDLDSFIRDKFLKRFYRGASGLIVAGNSGSVASLASSFSTGITSNTTAVLKYVDFVSAFAALDPAYQANAVWAMNNATLGAVLSITDSQNRPLFLPDYGSAAQGFIGTILGKPVKLVTQLPNVATGNAAVLVGDFKAGYTFRQQRPGVVIQRLNELYAAGMEVGFIGFARVGGIAKTYTNNPVLSITIK